jgi:hypothetical protein
VIKLGSNRAGIHFQEAQLREWLWDFIGIEMVCRMSSHAVQNVYH